MMLRDSTINHIVAGPPAAGGTIRLIKMTGSEALPLTELYDRATRVAAQLHARGVRAGDRIGILSANRMEWLLLDLAALRLKVVVAGFDPAKFEPAAALLHRYDLKLLFTDKPSNAAGIVPIAEVGQPIESPDGQPLPPVAYHPDDVTTLKFTSGSTGEPKGLAATVGSIDSSLHEVQQMFAHGPGDDLFVFLPLSLLQQRYWIYSALRHGHDVTVSTYEASLLALRQARPTVVMGVPGFYESARRHIEMLAAGTPESDLRAAAREVFGDRIRYLWTGSSPAAATMLRFFTSVGLPIYEGYGLNETCIVSKNHPGAHRAGSVGQVLAGKKVYFDENNVISIYSEYPVSRRYEYAAPGESERVFVDDMVRTSDTGYLDDDGFLYITGRVDDAIVLDNGRKILVRPLEEFMKQSPAIDECVVFRNARNQLIAVVSPACPARPDGVAVEIDARLALANSAFADEKISRVVVADPPFAVDNGYLTSQLKPRRKRIFDDYQMEIQDNGEKARRVH